MKQVNPLKYKHIQSYKDIVSSQKNSVTDALFVKHLERIQLRIDNYDKYKRRLEVIEHEAWDEDIKLLLLALYESRCHQWKQIKNEIRSISKNCLYCDLNEVSALEHYLPKGQFPEFSVLILNLFPCCDKCNRIKLQKWKDDNLKIRAFLNFYFDLINEVKFLFCNILIEDDVFIPSYELHFDKKDSFSRICRNHFEQLNLLNRYNEIANSTITSILNDFKNMKGTIVKDFNSEGINKYLFKQSKNDIDEYGINYWKGALYEGLANSEQFIDKVISENK